ncbi:ABC transporter substrate-binding protein [Paenibacillus xerothermodurans]|uniref:Carbohydrate ABC transporter substrate-binding protein n=1 Tax=Paenibacillus xerothermodurans TaxID=1977292 RepID=A0A2W1NBS7_PAEXE|nr:extracellular solute-binding protein [Paenibacillus xerothermodurans]PZE20561.1 carbohydrate ABC transporter substrate-binding protein [Paenibacillus xerothermodurans]
MKKTKTASVLCVLLASAWAITACGTPGSDEEGAASGGQTTLTVATNVVGEPAKVLQTIADKFMQENPDVKVEFSAPGAEYENIMKVKMASNSMPDVFATHGWSKARYGQYLLDLKDEPWAKQLDDAIKPAVTDESGKVYALPIDQDKSGPAYNAEVLEKYGVQVPTTWDELLAAAEQIKTKSNGEVTPIHIGGADSWPIGQFVDFMATSLFISPQNNFSKQLTDGSFDWTNFDKLPEIFLDLQKKGYLNKDVLTAKYSDSAKAFGEGKVAFGFYGPFLIEEAKKTNSNVKGGLMPIPSTAAGDTPTLAGGEKTTWGVWKDSKNIDAAKKFVAFYAKPENVTLVTAAQALPPGLKGIEINAGTMTADFTKYKDTRVLPYFDRAYLPNGMWDVMCKNGQDLLAGGISARQFSENMQKEYDRLRTTGK